MITSRAQSTLPNICQYASAVFCTSTSSSKITIAFASINSPSPHRPLITLRGWPGKRFLILTSTRLWKTPSGGMATSTISLKNRRINGKNNRSVALPIQ